MSLQVGELSNLPQSYVAVHCHVTDHHVTDHHVIRTATVGNLPTHLACQPGSLSGSQDRRREDLVEGNAMKVPEEGSENGRLHPAIVA